LAPTADGNGRLAMRRLDMAEHRNLVEAGHAYAKGPIQFVG
jgi:hypothetical protein